MAGMWVLQAELQVKDAQMERLGMEGQDVVEELSPMLKKCRRLVERLLVGSLALMPCHLWRSLLPGGR